METPLTRAFRFANDLKGDLARISLPPAEGRASEYEPVVYFSLVRGTRSYIEKIVHQVNGTYHNAWYDACAVMIRRLVETLLIEAFEHDHLDGKVKNGAGDFLQLDDLIGKALAEASWNLGRSTKRALGSIKRVGDRSAHSRRFIAQRQDIDRYIDDLRIVVQELTILAGMK